MPKVKLHIIQLLLYYYYYYYYLILEYEIYVRDIESSFIGKL
jgi:hypothetical protein